MRIYFYGLTNGKIEDNWHMNEINMNKGGIDAEVVGNLISFIILRRKYLF